MVCVGLNSNKVRLMTISASEPGLKIHSTCALNFALKGDMFQVGHL